MATTEEDITRLCLPHARPTHIRVVGHKGFAFVHFATVEESTRVHEAFQGAVIRGQHVRVGWGRAEHHEARRSVPPLFDDVEPSNNLWVG